MRRIPGGGLRKILIAATAALILAAMAGPAAAAPAPAATVEVRGGDILQPGQFIKNNFRFVPRNIA
jgi:ABC-type proline/glycine betaine transport system substrate-binding protein